jgi:rod shape determining protein RodA
MNSDPFQEEIPLYEPKAGHSWSQRLHVDLPLLAGLMLLSAVAFVVLFSAGGQHIDMVLRQAGRLGLALGIMLGIAQIHPRYLRLYSPALYLVGVLLLTAVLVFGETSLGATRWLNLGLVRFQPSEMTKLTMPMMIAWFLASQPMPPALRHVLLAGMLIIVPTAMIAKQPDLGTAMLVLASGWAVLFLAGLSWTTILVLAVFGGSLLPLLWHFMHGYQRDRVLMFLNPESDPLGRGYHIIQSKIAIGSGGIYGKGWLHGTQSHLDFLPEPSTDFVFAVLAEEFGLLGCVGLLAIYLFILARCFYIVVQAQDKFSRLLSGALTVTFFVYVFVNTGMVIGILPVVGVPLPLISYGGTSMVTLLAGFGILMSIQTHRKLLPPLESP